MGSRYILKPLADEVGGKVAKGCSNGAVQGIIALYVLIVFVYVFFSDFIKDFRNGEDCIGYWITIFCVLMIILRIWTFFSKLKKAKIWRKKLGIGDIQNIEKVSYECTKESFQKSAKDNGVERRDFFDTLQYAKKYNCKVVLRKVKREVKYEPQGYVGSKDWHDFMDCIVLNSQIIPWELRDTLKKVAKYHKQVIRDIFGFKLDISNDKEIFQWVATLGYEILIEKAVGDNKGFKTSNQFSKAYRNAKRASSKN